MTLLADERVARAIIEQFRADGHALVAICEVSPGIADTQVLSEVERTQAVLLTEDKDFGELVFRGAARTSPHLGVVLLRLAGLSRDVRAFLVSEAFKVHGAEFVGAFNNNRIRPASPPTDETGA